MQAPRTAAPQRPAPGAPRAPGQRHAGCGSDRLAYRRRDAAARAADTRLTSPAPAAADEAPPPGDESRCPVLAALRAPPPARLPFWRRLDQLFKPFEYARDALAGGDMAAAPAELNLPAQYVLGRPEHVKTVFSGEAEGLTTTTLQGVAATGRLMGRNHLLAAPEPRHSYLRRLIMPAFSGDAIEKLLPRMRGVLSKYLESWADERGPVKAHEQLRTMTFEFIIAVVMGRDYPPDVTRRMSGCYAAWARGILAWPYIDLPFTSFGRALAAKDQLMAFFKDALDEARSELAQGRQVMGILGSLVAAVDEDGNTLTDDEILDNLLLIMLAGHDTSSTTLTSCIANLQENPEATAKLREEQQRVVRAHGAAITGAALKDMAYTDAVIRETLRVNNVVGGLQRMAAKDFELDGFLIPKGTVLLLPLSYLALSDERWAGERGARAFRPERMLTAEGMKPGAQMPFGHGPRFCAGYSVAMAEMKVFLALLARGYDFTADTATTWRQEIGRVPANGLPLTLARRAPPAGAGAGAGGAACR